MVVSGHVRNGLVVLDEPAALPEGAELRIKIRGSGVSLTSKQKRMMECVRALRKLGPIVGMEDPVTWQRSLREDRSLSHGK